MDENPISPPSSILLSFLPVLQSIEEGSDVVWINGFRQYTNSNDIF